MNSQHTPLVVSSKLVSQLKQKAKHIKRTNGIQHVLALDQVAREAGFHHWKQVIELTTAIKPVEDAYLTGLVVAHASGESYPLNEKFARAPEAFYFCEQDFRATLSKLNRQLLNVTPGERLSHRMEIRRVTEILENLKDYIFFRYEPLDTPCSWNDALKLIDPSRDYFTNLHLWLRSEHHDLCDYDLRGDDIPGSPGEI